MIVYGWRAQYLTPAQIAARQEIADRHGAEFDVYHDGKSQYCVGDEAVRSSIKDEDLALNDGAPPADWQPRRYEDRAIAPQ